MPVLRKVDSCIADVEEATHKMLSLCNPFPATSLMELSTKNKPVDHEKAASEIETFAEIR